MTELIHVPSYGPLVAEYAAVGQSPGRQEGIQGRPFVGPAGSLARDWLTGASISPDSVRYLNVYEYVLLGDEKPSAADVKHGVERVKRELTEMPNLRAVVLFGSYAARLAFSLKGGITQVHGRQGTIDLPDGRQIDCLACLHPSYVIRQQNLRQRQQLDNDCRAVVARLTFLDKPLVLPAIRVTQETEFRATGLVGLDTETASQTGKRPDPRRDPLLITGLSDGTVFTRRVPVTGDAEPAAWNVPFDPVVTGQWDAKWHDGKVLAHLVGEFDTSMKGCATRILNRPMMDYDPQLRERASAHIAQGDYTTDEVRTFSAYCVQDALAHKDLLEALLTRADAGTRYLYDVIERPMLRLYSKWSMLGVFDLDRSRALLKRDQIDARMREMKRQLLSETGIESQNASAKLAVALGIPETNAVWVERNWRRLDARQRRVLKLVSEMRGLHRQGTRIDTWLNWDLDLISTIWRPTAAWTGRPGSAGDNLQNIPGPCGDSSCGPCRAQRPLECPWNLKPLLVAPEGKVLYEADNSQAELRVAAHLSQDDAMLRAFREGIDIDGERVYDLHAWAQRTLGITSRRDAKIRVLATFYGQSEEGASASPEIQIAIRRIFAGYVRWSNKVRRLSIVPGLFGRNLHVPPHANEGHREREAVNAPSQGGAVDILKLQCLSLESSGLDTRHMIHDSALVMADAYDAGRELEESIRETMEGAVKLSVPLKVEVGPWPH